jgi:hypothetical protein
MTNLQRQCAAHTIEKAVPWRPYGLLQLVIYHFNFIPVRTASLQNGIVALVK